MLFVGVTQMYNNKEIYLCNGMLVLDIFGFQYSTINNSTIK